jgi:hypothetical protein
LNFSTIVSLLVGGLTASGTAWILESHPAKKNIPNTAVHWLLPSLTALVMMLAVNQLPFSGNWWIAAFTGGFVLMLVVTAEYIVLDADNPYYPPAEMGITALSIVLFTILSISLHFTQVRLFYRVPVISLAALLVYLRVIHLRQNGLWAITKGSVPFLLIGEIAAGLHYFPMGSINFGVALAGPLYALIEISDSLPDEEFSFRISDLILPLLIVIFSSLLALLV